MTQPPSQNSEVENMLALVAAMPLTDRIDLATDLLAFLEAPRPPVGYDELLFMMTHVVGRESSPEMKQVMQTLVYAAFNLGRQAERDS